MKRLILILGMIGIMPNAYTQSTLLWSENFMYGLSDYTTGDPSIQTIGDTIKVMGKKNTPNGQRLLIEAYDLLGETRSTRTYGSDSVSNNLIIGYQLDGANHVYILQEERLSSFQSKIVLQKYHLDGHLIWVEQIQDTSTSYVPLSLGLANDTSLFITAYKQYDYIDLGDEIVFQAQRTQLYAYHSDGSQLWRRDFNPSTEINRLHYGLFVLNNTAVLVDNNNNLAQVDLNNNLSVHLDIDIAGGVNDIQMSPDGNLIITARLGYRIAKVGMDGSLIWLRQYGTNLPSNVSGDEMKALIQDSAGNIYVTGRHYGANYGTPDYTNADILTLKYDSNGNLIWQNRYQYGTNHADIGNTIRLKNGQVYVGGQSQGPDQGVNYGYVVLKMDLATGSSTGAYRYAGLADEDHQVSSLSVFDNGHVALTGLSYIDTQYSWTTQLLSDVILSVGNIDPESNFQVYPNPILSGEDLTVLGPNIKSYAVFSSLGQLVEQGEIETHDVHTIPLSRLTTGVYLLCLKTDHQMMTYKVVVK